jgi:hypothetical protein
MSVQPMPPALPGERRLSLKEQIQRAAAIQCIERREKTALCASMIHVGIFFDGTNNNKKRDQLDILEKEPKDFNKCSHSNVVVLHDAFRDDPKNGYYRIYVPGVGTPFDEIGEKTETPDGKAKATGGDARINWALIQLLNAMHRAIHEDKRLISNSEAGRLATQIPLHADGSTGANMAGKRLYFVGRATGLNAGPGGKLGELKRALQAKPPKKLVQVNLSVFGFSRGAAQARAFCHFLHHLLLEEKNGSYTLADVPFRIQFMGLFDSVASVGLADSSPFWRGLGGWANGTLDIVPSVERTVHLCAAHEIRINFPLSTGRTGDNKYPSNCIEKVYPGAHSNVGGGYDPGCQGKAVDSRAKLLSQMPLLDMYHEARNSAVPLLSSEHLRKDEVGRPTANDLDIDQKCADLFNAYRDWSLRGGVGSSIEAAQHGHMQLYWRWRLAHTGNVTKLPSYQRAGEQDRIDMRESDADFSSDMAAALWQERTESDLKRNEPLAAVISGLSEAQKDFLRIHSEFVKGAPASKLPPAIDHFFDQLVHDSHASFYMVGPVTAFDRKEKIKQIEQKVEANRRFIASVKESSAALILPPGTVRQPLPPMDETRSLSELERRIWEHQKTHPGEFPLLTDADRSQLLAMEDVVTSGAVRLVTNKTRRELGGHVRYRRVFDRS